MVSSDKSADRNVSSEKLHKRLSSHSNIKVSQETYENKSDSSKPEGLRDIPSAEAKEEGQDSGATMDALLSDQEGSDCSSPLQKPLQSSNTVQRASDAQDSPSVLCEKPSKPNVAEKEMQNSDATADALHSDKEGSSFSLPHEKPLQKPNTALRALQSGQESPSIIREKVSKDGYHWRKYGQKHVKGNEFIRSYYKCTHPNCLAKKQLEQSNNGQITDTVCIGQHNHPQVNITLPVDRAVTAVKDRTDKPSFVDGKDKASVEHAAVPNQVKPLEALPLSTVSTDIEVKAALLQSTRTRDVVVANEDPVSKRLKKNNSNADVTGVEKSTGESRVVVQTSSEVDFVNDGYRWRKYGQKLVKGNPNPRSYYRCSNPGCPVKKHVERASHDHKIVITTYEGHHVHESLSGRTVTYNGAASTPTTNTNGDLRTKSTVNTICAQTAEPTCLDSDGRRNEQLTGDKTAKPKSNDMVESTSNEKEQNSNSCTERDSVNLDASCHTVSELPCKLDERQKDEDSDATTDALLLDQEGSDCFSPLQKPLQSSNTIQPALNVQDTPSVECKKVPKDNIAEKEMQDSDATPDALHSDKDGSTFSLSHEKPLEKPNTAPLALEFGQDSPSIIREKVFKDGYHWRKYGQKHVKGNGFIRSYYRCTHPNCLAKKQLEQSNNGQITDIVCIGQHNHSQVNITLPVDSAVTAVKDRPDKLSLVNVADKASVEHAAVPHRVKPLEALPILTVSTMNEVKAALLQSTRKRDEVVTNKDPELKRLKKNNTKADVSGVEKSTGESRVVDQTSSEVDFVNDRQKLVKGNPNSRSYYSTSNPGCHVKKKVERTSHDHKTVITTYEGHHDHESPFGRTVTHNGAASIPTTNTNSDSRTKSKENSVCAHTAESTCLDSQNRQNEQLTGDKTVKPKSNDIVESTSNEKEHNGNTCTEKDSVNLDTACHTGSELPCKIDEQQKDEVRIILEESKDGSKLNKQCTPDADPIQS